MFLEKEIWVSVHNADNYLISNLGNIKTKDRYITDKNGNRNNKVRKAFGKKILCIETNIVYDSIHEAGIKNNIRPAMISKCCNGNRETAHGYHWKFI